MINKPIVRVFFCRFGFEVNVFGTLTKIVVDKFNQFVCFDFFTVSCIDMKEALPKFAV